MNKAGLIQAIAIDIDLTQVAASRLLNIVTRAINSTLANGEPVSLFNFGTFSVQKCQGYSGRNPSTGTKIQIAETNVVHFKAGKELKAIVNSSSNSNSNST